MLTILEDYLERLEALHTDIHHAIAGLPSAALDWTPEPDMNSLAVLAAHVAGSERYWIGEVVGRVPSGRDREAEFRTRGLDKAVLANRLVTTLAHSRATLDELTLSDLEAGRTAPRDGRQCTVAWALCHALEHTALHLGQMQLMRQLWEQGHHEHEAGDNQAVILQIRNHHTVACGAPPQIAERSGQYVGYFENRYGEQMIFVFDQGRQNGLLYAGDAGWESPYPVVEGIAEGLILNSEERQWLHACWDAVAVAK